MRRLSRVVAAVALLLLLLTAGCYTVLRHPTGSEVVQEGSYYRTCADCHADASFYHPYGNQYYRYGRSHYSWGDYYGYPWWYDDYWWWDHHGDDDHDGPEVETGSRHLWSSSGWASGGWGFTKPGSSPRVPTPPRAQKDDDKKEEKKQEDEKKSEDERNLWKKPKKKGF